MSLEFYAYGFSEMNMDKPVYQRIFEFIVEYVKEHGGRRGAFSEAAKLFYPDLYEKNRRYAVKLVYENFRYALRKYRTRLWNRGFGTFWNEVFGLSGTGFGTDRIDGSIDMNMGYYVGNHSGPIHESKFAKDSKADRRLFEFKKLVYAILKPLVKPKSTLLNYVEKYTRDPRVVDIINRLDENIWYNGKDRYVKLPRKAAALLYLVIAKIYQEHYGVGNKPEKLIKSFFETTGHGPRDLEKELRELISTFYDWLLFIG